MNKEGFLHIPYLNYNTLLKEKFGSRVQKISINAGFTCPNRDGNLGYGGCTYCNNQSFSPNFKKDVDPIQDQIDQNIIFFNKRYKSQKYLAYFQSYTNTYDSVENLQKIYGEALKHPKIDGIVVGTRPDCVSDDLLDYFAELAQEKYVMIEYGIESTNNKTLEFIRRGHNYQSSIKAIEATAKRNIHTGAHLILGLPGESNEEIIKHASEVSKLPLNTLKLHQLQLVKGTIMAKQFKTNPEWFSLYSKDEYINLVSDFVENLNPAIAIERFISQSPLRLLIAPTWGIKNFEFANELSNYMISKKCYQGKKYNIKS